MSVFNFFSHVVNIKVPYLSGRSSKLYFPTALVHLLQFDLIFTLCGISKHESHCHLFELEPCFVCYNNASQKEILVMNNTHKALAKTRAHKAMAKMCGQYILMHQGWGQEHTCDVYLVLSGNVCSKLVNYSSHQGSNELLLELLYFILDSIIPCSIFQLTQLNIGTLTSCDILKSHFNDCCINLTTSAFP